VSRQRVVTAAGSGAFNPFRNACFKTMSFRKRFANEVENLQRDRAPKIVVRIEFANYDVTESGILRHKDIAIRSTAADWLEMELIVEQLGTGGAQAETSGYAQGLCALGVVDAALGNKEDAIREGELAVKLMPANKSAIEGSVLTQYLAIIHAWTGDKDRAIEQLAEAAKLPGSHVTYGYLRLHPLWDPLRDDPRFEQIVASLAPKH